MTCDRCRDLAELLKDGALAPAEASAVREHLETCEACREFEADCVALVAPLRGLPPGPYLPPSPWGRLPPWISGSGTTFLLLALLLAVSAGVSLALLGPAGGTPGTEHGSAAPPAERGVSAVAPRETASAPTTERTLDPGDGCVVTGRVLLAAGGGPAAGARVTVQGAAPVVTDASGLFTLEGLRPGGARSLRVEAPGCVAMDAVLMTLWPGEIALLADLETGRAAEARVAVLDMAGRPVPGARVEARRFLGESAAGRNDDFGPALEPLRPAPSATTGGDGEARFEGLAPGEWTFTAEAPGFARSRPAVGRAPTKAASACATVVLEPGVAFEGRILESSTGAPVPGAAVAWHRAADNGESLRTTTWTHADESGAFRFPSVPAAPLLLVAWRPGAAFLATTQYADAGALPVAEVRLAPEGTVEGGVLDAATGGPAVGAYVRLDVDPPREGYGGGSSPAFVRADARGRFVLRGVPVGSQVSARVLPGIGWAPGTARMRWPTREWDGPRLEEDLVVEATRSGEVTGRLLDAAGQGRPGRFLVLLQRCRLGISLSEQPTACGTAWSDAEGRFRIRGVPPGPAVLVERDPARPADGWNAALLAAADALASAAPPPCVVSVPPGERVEAASWLSATPARPGPGPAAGHAAAVQRIRGTVTGPGGDPPAGLRLRLLDGDQTNLDRMGPLALIPFGELVPVAADGTFEASPREPLPAAPRDEGSTFTLRACAPGCLPATVAVRVPRAGSAENVRVDLREGKALAGRILRSDGAPAAGVPVEALGMAPGGRAAFTPLWPQARTDEEGRFRIAGLHDEPHHLLLGWPGARIHQAVDLRPGGAPVEIRLPPTAPLRGVVRTPDGAPAAGVHVEWRAEDGSRRSVSARTAGDGSFLLPEVPLAAHTLVVGSPFPDQDTGAVVQQTLAHREAPSAPVEVVAPRGLEISGIVLGAAGPPPEGARVSCRFEVEGNPRVRSARCGPDGSFVLRGLPPGRHVLRYRDGWAEAEAGAQGVRIVLGGEQGALLEGRVMDGADPPSALVDVSALRPDPPGPDEPQVLARTVPDGAGRFRLRLPTRDRVVVIARWDDGGAVYADGVEPGCRELYLRRGGPPAGTLRGRVLDDRGSPIPGAHVRALRLREDGTGTARVVLEGNPADPFDVLGEAAVRATVSGPDGAFDLGSPAGRWAVFAGTPGATVVPLAAVVWVSASPAPLEVGAGPGWTLRGRAAAEGAPSDSSPLPAAAEVEPSGFLPAGAPSVLLRVPIRADGSFEVPGLPPFPAQVRLLDARGEEVGRATVAPLEDRDPPAEIPSAR